MTTRTENIAKAALRRAAEADVAEAAVQVADHEPTPFTDEHAKLVTAPAEQADMLQLWAALHEEHPLQLLDQLFPGTHVPLLGLPLLGAEVVTLFGQ